MTGARPDIPPASSRASGPASGRTDPSPPPQPQPLLLGQPAPDPEPFVVGERVFETRGTALAQPADTLRLPDRTARLGEEEIAPRLSTQRPVLPGDVGRGDRFDVHGRDRVARPK